MAELPRLEAVRAQADRWNLAHRRGDFEQIDVEIRARAVRVVEGLRRLGLGPSAQVLEVGCGTGWFSGRLTEFGQVTALDLSEAAVEVARRRRLPVRFVADDFYAHPFPDARFDLVVCLETLFYVHDQPAFVDKIARILRRGGILALSTVNRWVYERSRDVGPPEPGQVRQWLSQRQVRALLRPSFEVLSTSTVAPRGDLGLLRLVNSYKVNAALERVMAPATVRRAKERLGLGGGIVTLARRRAR